MITIIKNFNFFQLHIHISFITCIFFNAVCGIAHTPIKSTNALSDNMPINSIIDMSTYPSIDTSDTMPTNILNKKNQKSDFITHDPIVLPPEKIDDTTYRLQVQFMIDEPDVIYHDYITISTDCPDIILSDWQSSIAPESHYDSTFKQAKKIYTQSFYITFTASKQNFTMHTTYIHIAYYQKLHQKIKQIQIPCEFNKISMSQLPENKTHNNFNQTSPINRFTTHKKSWPTYNFFIVNTIQSPLLYMIFLILMGIIMYLLLIPSIAQFISSLVMRIFCILFFIFLYSLLFVTPWHIASWILATTISIIGILCMRTNNKVNQSIVSRTQTGCGMIILAFSIFLYFKAYQAFYIHRHTQSSHYTYIL